MSAEFNELIFDANLVDTNPVFSRFQFADHVGKADDLVYELEVVAVTGTPTLTLTQCLSNSGGPPIPDSSDLYSAVVAAGTRKILVRAGPLAAKGLLKVGISASSSAHVKIWMAGIRR
jgi:hypothetical protein